MEAVLEKKIQIRLSMDEAKKVLQDLRDLDPARANVESMSLRDRLHLLTTTDSQPQRG